MEDLISFICAMLYMGCSHYCKSRGVSFEDFQEAYRACDRWCEEHPEATQKEVTAWLRKHMDEKFPERT